MHAVSLQYFIKIVNMNRVKNCTHDKCAGLSENLPRFRLQNWTSLWPALNPLSVPLIESQIKEVKKCKDQIWVSVL